MAHDVFVSYSSKDKSTADVVCAALESHDIRCWVAPRDILPGQEWGGSIIEAIKGARAMVLVFSSNANTSPQIRREVERAVNKGLPVIPFRIENVAPTETLEYFISTPQWLDAFTLPLEPYLESLVEAVRKYLGGPEVSSAAVAEREAGEKAEAEAARFAEEKRQAAQLAELKLAEEKKAAEAKAARLADKNRKLTEAAKAAEAKRKAAKAAERVRLADEERARAAEAKRKAAKTAERARLADEERARAAEAKRKAAKAAERAQLADEERARPAEITAQLREEERNKQKVLGIFLILLGGFIGFLTIYNLSLADTLHTWKGNLFCLITFMLCSTGVGLLRGTL